MKTIIDYLLNAPINTAVVLVVTVCLTLILRRGVRLEYRGERRRWLLETGNRKRSNSSNAAEPNATTDVAQNDVTLL